MSKTGVQVSVVIVNYNGKKFIGECIDSVLQSEYPNFEVVMVDNASTDGSCEYLKKTYGRNKKIKIVRSEKQLYFAGGSNLGATNSKGEKLIFLNSDTVVNKDWIKELVAFTKNHEKYLAQPKILLSDKKNVIDSVGGYYNFFGFGFGKGRGEKDIGQYDKHIPVDYVNGTIFIIDKKFFEQVGGFDEWYKFHYEDIDLSLRAKKRGADCWCCYKSVAYHKGSLTLKGSVPKEQLLFDVRKNRLMTVIKNFNGWNRVFRISALMLVNLVLVVQDLLTFKSKRMFLTIKSVLAVIAQEYKFFINWIRFWELKSFVKRENFSLLDLGCGDGSFLHLARQRGIEALGVDQSPPLHPQVIASSIEELKLKKQFDVTTMFHVLEHVKEPEKVLAKVKTFLKKNGHLVVEVPLVGNFTEKFLEKDYFAYQDKTHVNFFTKRVLLALLNKHGWKIKRKGFTLMEFPLTVLTTSFRKNFWKCLIGMILFFPLKVLSILGLNDEVVRLYCVEKEKSSGNPYRD